MKEVNRVGFVYTLEHLKADGSIKSVEHVTNLIPTEGVNYILGSAFNGVSAYSSWYLSLYDANRTPIAGDTMTTFIADCQENTVYVGATRPTISFPAVIDGVLSTTAAPNEILFNAPSVVAGGFITTNPTRGNDAGMLISAVLFPSPKVMAAGESLRIPVGFSLLAI
jgi:hypothetical protein